MGGGGLIRYIITGLIGAFVGSFVLMGILAAFVGVLMIGGSMLGEDFAAIGAIYALSQSARLEPPWSAPFRSHAQSLLFF